MQQGCDGVVEDSGGFVPLREADARHPDKSLPANKEWTHGGLLLKHRTRIRLANIVQISSISITVFAAHRAWAAARARTVEGIY